METVNPVNNNSIGDLSLKSNFTKAVSIFKLFACIEIEVTSH